METSRRRHRPRLGVLPRPSTAAARGLVLVLVGLIGLLSLMSTAGCGSPRPSADRPSATAHAPAVEDRSRQPQERQAHCEGAPAAYVTNPQPAVHPPAACGTGRVPPAVPLVEAGGPGVRGPDRFTPAEVDLHRLQVRRT